MMEQDVLELVFPTEEEMDAMAAWYEKMKEEEERA